MPAKEGPDTRASQKVLLPDERLLELLVCPVTKSTLILNKEGPEDCPELVSVAAAVAYPIRDGIPIMLEEEARPLTEAEQTRYKKV